jgi:ribosome-associated toxin RatA of RatAB toxin-antitoxin module
MADLSYFESRTGNLSCSAKDVFSFVTDIRNFEQFIPVGTIENWQAEKESCSFSVSMLGTVSFSLAEKEMYNKVVFTGDALKKNDFSLFLHISDNTKNQADVKVSLSADLNPMMKMMAAKPIAQFLEILISEMESFRGWKDIRV